LSRSYLCHFGYSISDFASGDVVLTKDHKMPKPRNAVAVDPAKSKTLDRRHSTSVDVVQFKSGSSLEVCPSQRLHPSDGGDPGPAGFDWKELKPFKPRIP
jgi:hypothetical protein